VLTLLSGSENNSNSNIKFPMHSTLIFKEQAKFKEIGLREKGLAQPHYSIQHIEGYDLFLCYKDNIYIPQSLRQTEKSTVLVPSIFTSFWIEQSRKDYQEYHDMAWSHTKC
jgi:hypothetical protein